MSHITLTTLHKRKRNSEKITCLTAYDASFAHHIDTAGIDILLVGDSLGMVVQGHDSTLPVTLDDMIYHTRMVRRGTENAFIVADMPFMSYATSETTLRSAARLMSEGQAQMVKVEGGAWLTNSVRMLIERGIPVCGHLGLTPQSVHQFGGYRVQGRQDQDAERLFNDALVLEQAGIALLVLECIPATLAKRISEALEIPTIGIGAGVGCDGQVLVTYDLLGLTHGKSPSFSKNFLAETDSIPAAIAKFIHDVKNGTFPAVEHTFE